MTPGLGPGNFRRIAAPGFGDGANSYAHAMAWFDGHLYVCTSRASFVVHRLTTGFVMPPLHCWPVSLPPSMDLWDVDLRSQVWRWDPTSDTWSAVWTSPWREGRDGRRVPASMALRSIAVFQGKSDPAPALYLPTFPPSLLGEGAVMLRSADGITYEVVSEPGVALLEWGFRSFRTLLPFKGRLFTAPTMGSVRGRPNLAGVAAVLCSADPARGEWQVANEGGFGDPNNLTVFELGVFDDHLYAGVANLVDGLQLWKTDGEGDPPFRWTLVMSHGAWRGKLNQGVVAMEAFGDCLYLSSAVQGGGYDRANKIGPAPAELLRVHADDHFDLVVGDPRDTPVGMKVPLSGFRAGFGNPLAGYFWRMCAYEDWLYLGTFDSSPILPFHTLSTAPEFVRTLLSGDGLEYFMRMFGGFDLWRTPDGVTWVPVTRNGFGNRYACGVRNMCVTPYGLAVGTTNPFGPDVATRRTGGWVYEPNPQGGLEIWLGHRDWRGAGAPPQPAEPLRIGGSEASETAACESLLDEFYGGSDFRHVGYWRETSDVRTACEELVAEAASLLPERPARLVDVGCGLGATTRALAARFPDAAITAVCTDARGFYACTRNAPRARVVIGLPRLRFREGSFDAAVCLETLAAVRSRARVLHEIRRVLAPGGRLVVTDLLSANGGAPTTADDYRRLLESVGFDDVVVHDRTFECWTRFTAHRGTFLGVRWLGGQIDAGVMERVAEALPGGTRAIAGYVLASARRPPDH